MRNNRSIIIIIVFISFLTVMSVQAEAFNVPEWLKYELKWLGIKAGTATMSVEMKDSNYVIESRAESTDFISSFYKVDDRITCIVDGSGGEYGKAINYHLKLREGSSRKDKEVRFRQDEKKALYLDHRKKEKKIFDIVENSYDPLSGFFSLRRMELHVGKPVILKIFDSKKVWDVVVDIIKKEKIKVRAGEFDTILIKPNLQSEGIFSSRGDIFIWVTDDHRKVPVKIQLEALIGHVTAELKEIKD
ncbi:MAG: DUF3108 domain-containing protein [Nitrospirota bacterium]|nr:MAG: DUF3108 domain-containing protein [Nitrospirota bacterium]